MAAYIFLLDPTAPMPMSLRSSNVIRGSTSSSTSWISNTGAYRASPSPSSHAFTPPHPIAEGSRLFGRPQSAKPSDSSPLASRLPETLALAAAAAAESDWSSSS
uniref:Uncharacterized protein n=1 Tax=Arundo donax TaxID=35708 RepID=A0A0A9EB53_ARUDO